MNLNNLLKFKERPSFDEYFITLAAVVATRSTCARRKVGAVLVDNNHRIIGTGYNGVAKGLPHCTDINCPGAKSKPGQNLDSCEAIHGEVNALINCADHLRIHTLYCTASPCVSCTKLMMNTSCERIVYLEEYPSNGSHLWKQLNRAWERLNV